MNGSHLALGFATLFAGASELRRKGSRAALQPTMETALIVVERDPVYPVIVLIDASLVSRLGLKGFTALNSCESCVLGFIKLSVTYDCDDETGTGPLEVQNVVARKGWGPLVYDSALWFAAFSRDICNGCLVSDRSEISSSARNIWKFYAEKRKNDVTSHMLASTCNIHGQLNPDPVVDLMYRADVSAPAFKLVQQLSDRGQELLDHIEGAGGLERGDVEEVLLKLGEKLFARQA